jgi:hypothetical protein
VSAFCERCDAYIDTDGEPVACIDCLHELRWWESEARARAIRAVVAAQWGVAIECVLYAWDRRIDDDLWPLFVALKDLPCAVDLIDGVTT